MAKSRHRKKHKQKLKSRRIRKENEKRHRTKINRSMVEKIMEEQKKGLYGTNSNSEESVDKKDDKDLGDIELG